MDRLAASITHLHSKIVLAIRTQIRNSSPSDNVKVSNAIPVHGDLSYSLDVRAEKIVDHFFREGLLGCSVTVVCEGLGVRSYPEGVRDEQAEFRVIIDPLDGTRELAYDKRSAWILTGVALNRGDQTTLADIFFSMQTEVSPSKQRLGSVLWAIKGKGANDQIWDLDQSRLADTKPVKPSEAHNLEHGFAVFVDFFFPGPKRTTSEIAHKVLSQVLGEHDIRTARVFNDQYISTGGQIYLLATGAYRMIADLRSLIATRNCPAFTCAHSYDLSTWLIAAEAGVLLTNGCGEPLQYPLDTQTSCSWIGYCNEHIKHLVDPVLRNVLGKYIAQ